MDALEQRAGNQSKAANLLGISRGTLLVRLSLYGLPRPCAARQSGEEPEEQEVPFASPLSGYWSLDPIVSPGGSVSGIGKTLQGVRHDDDTCELRGFSGLLRLPPAVVCADCSALYNSLMSRLYK
ncbi:MAG: helix-turn-helix domain-containing protein [Byssovorax sp.]